MSGLPANVSPDVKRLNPHLWSVETTPAPDRQMAREDVKAAITMREERELQALCENYLVQREYARLTAANAGDGIRGYFGHLNKPRGNPLMPDLFIFDLRARVLLVELKVRYVFQPGQLEMVKAGLWRLCSSFDEFRALLNEWESQIAQ